jgi:hypothetical protein
VTSHRWNDRLSDSTREEMEYLERRERQYRAKVRQAERERDELAAKLAALQAQMAATA